MTSTSFSVIAILGWLTGVAPWEGGAAADPFRDAREMLKAKDFEKARDTMTGLVPIAPANAEGYALLAEAWEGLGDNDLAAAFYRKALEVAAEALKKGKDRTADAVQRSVPRRLQKADTWGAERRQGYQAALKRMQKVAAKADEEKRCRYASDVYGKMIGLVEKLAAGEAVKVAADEKTLGELKKGRAAVEKKPKPVAGSLPGGDDEIRAARRDLAQALLKLVDRQVACFEKSGMGTLRPRIFATLGEVAYHEPEAEGLVDRFAQVWKTALAKEKPVELLVTIDALGPYKVSLNGIHVGAGDKHKDGATTFEAKGVSGQNLLAIEAESKQKITRTPKGGKPEDIEATALFVNVKRTDTNQQWGSKAGWEYAKEVVPGWNVQPEAPVDWLKMEGGKMENFGKKFRDKRIVSPDGELILGTASKVYVRFLLDL